MWFKWLLTFVPFLVAIYNWMLGIQFEWLLISHCYLMLEFGIVGVKLV